MRAGLTIIPDHHHPHVVLQTRLGPSQRLNDNDGGIDIPIPRAPFCVASGRQTFAVSSRSHDLTPPDSRMPNNILVLQWLWNSKTIKIRPNT